MLSSAPNSSRCDGNIIHLPIKPLLPPVVSYSMLRAWMAALGQREIARVNGLLQILDDGELGLLPVALAVQRASVARAKAAPACTSWPGW